MTNCETAAGHASAFRAWGIPVEGSILLATAGGAHAAPAPVVSYNSPSFAIRRAAAVPCGAGSPLGCAADRYSCHAYGP